MKYSKEDILEILISSYHFQAEFDPVVGKGMEPNFETTIFEWRDICDLIEPKKLAQLYHTSFNLKTPFSELEQLFVNEDKSTLSDFCAYISKNAKRQNIEPIKLLGQNCQTASIFRTLKRNLKEKGADISELKPSSKINPFFLKHGGILVDEVNRIAPGTMSEFEFKSNKFSRIGRNIMFIGFFAGIGIWSIWSFNWFLFLPIIIGIVIFQIGDKRQPEKIKHMKKAIILLIVINCYFNASAQKHLSAEESDPNKMGWMQGFPPSKEQLTFAQDGTFFTFPALRYSVCHMRQFLPTTEVAAAQNNRYEFQVNLDTKIDSLTFTPWNSEKKMSWKQSLSENYTDGMLILHKGKIVYEKYFGALSPEGVHAAMSVSKTFTGTLGALLVTEGILDENKTAKTYVPELNGSAFGDATIRQILDMTTSLKYSEDYSDPNAEVWIFSAAGNPLPKPKEYNGPKNYYEYLQTVKKEDLKHGEVFAYKTINTDVMGWIISRVTGKSLTQLLSERIWKPLGTYIDGYYQVDSSGIAFAGGGFSANLRDMGMFGEMIRNNGFFNNKQIFPAPLIKDIMNGGSQEAFRKSAYSSLENWSYRNMWWITHNANGAFAARGVHGQTIYIDPTAEMVIVRFSSHPEAKNSKIDPTSLPAYQAVADYLLNK